MKKMYLLKSIEGSYEDIYEHNIAVYEDESLALIERDIKNKEQQCIEDKFSEFMNKSDELYSSFEETRRPELIAGGCSEDEAEEIYNIESELLLKEYKCDYNWERVYYHVNPIDVIDNNSKLDLVLGYLVELTGTEETINILKRLGFTEEDIISLEFAKE